MKRQRIVFWIGFLLYVASFFLIAVVVRGGGETGISCAQAALLYPWTHLNGMLLSNNPLEFFSILISGWINPFFLITIILMSRKQFPRTIAILRFIILLMIPFCWIVFYYEELYPREGHFLWVIGMLLMLFSDKLRNDEST